MMMELAVIDTCRQLRVTMLSMTLDHVLSSLIVDEMILDEDASNKKKFIAFTFMMETEA